MLNDNMKLFIEHIDLSLKHFQKQNSLKSVYGPTKKRSRFLLWLKVEAKGGVRLCHLFQNTIKDVLCMWHNAWSVKLSFDKNWRRFGTKKKTCAKFIGSREYCSQKQEATK